MTQITMKNDAQIRDDVLEELRWDPRVEETEVGVQVKTGVVTLTGTVTSYGKKLAAVEAAHRVAGVLDVANDVEVRVPGGQTRTDSEIAQAVRHTLEWDVYVPDQRIRSTVSAGWVSLEGEVDRWSQREDAARAVQRLAGVRGVTTLIKVATPAIDSEKIRESIEQALERRVDREARQISVGVHNGAVTLSGKVQSWPEKRAVYGVASCAAGVKSVEDRLVVDPYS